MPPAMEAWIFPELSVDSFQAIVIESSVTDTTRSPVGVEGGSAIARGHGGGRENGGDGEDRTDGEADPHHNSPERSNSCGIRGVAAIGSGLVLN